MFLFWYAWIKGSTWILIFDVNKSLEFRTISKKITSFAMGKSYFFIRMMVIKVNEEHYLYALAFLSFKRATYNASWSPVSFL